MKRTNDNNNSKYDKVHNLDVLMHIPIPKEGNFVPFYVSKMEEIIFEHLIEEKDEIKQLNKKLETRGFLLNLESWIIDIFTISNENQMREYAFRVCNGKMSHYTSLFMGCTFIQMLKNKIEERMGIPQKDITPFLRSHELLLFDKPIYKLNQMELYQQILLLAQKWFLLQFSTTIFEVVRCLFSRLSILINCTQTGDVLNGIIDKDKKRGQIIENIQYYFPSMEFIDTMSCIYQDFMNSLLIRNVINKRMSYSDIKDTFEGFDMKLIQKNIEEWVHKESKIVSDDRFKELLRDFCIINSLKCGEKNIVIRENGGVLPSSGVGVIEKSRTPNQLTWWATQSIQKTIGITLNPRLPIIRNSCIIKIFDSYCQPMKFEWGNTVLLNEKRFLSKIEDCLLYTSPIIFQSMGSFHVYYRSRWYDTEKIEIAIFVWLYFLKQNKFKYTTLCENKKLEKLKILYDIFIKDPDKMEIDQQQQEKKKSNCFKVPL
jgi:hypothetical protein